ELTQTLGGVADDLYWLPKDQLGVEHDRQEAVDWLDRDQQRLEQAHDYLNQHDRVLRRRGHETGITNAHNTIEVLPDQIRERQTEIARLDDKLDNLSQRLVNAQQLHTEQPALETRLAHITSRLDNDANIRAHQIRANTPDHITDTLGARPTGGHHAQAWDHTAGRLDQHQTAHHLNSGLGPKPPHTHSTGFDHSQGLVTAAIQNLTQQRQHTLETEHPHIGIGR
ncbi:MAG: hypothetical protein KJN63_05210, partial [Acidimicrobiia bacterium]|nr:hypothetical protein [Acidimicrobiia bacterium]